VVRVDLFTDRGYLSIDLVVSYGIDHDIYRFGDYLVVWLLCIGWVIK